MTSQEQLALDIANRPFPKVTPEDVEKSVVLDQYHVFPGTTLTVCCLTLVNGFTVTGEAACADPRNFDESIGRRQARSDAMKKIWPLLGYALRERLHAGGRGIQE